MMKGAFVGFIVEKEPYLGGKESERVFCVRANNPSPMTYTGTNTWIVAEPGADKCIVIDPAPAGEHIQNVLATCENLGLSVGAIICTHNHPDHTEGAAELASVTGARVYAPFDGSLPLGEFQPFLDAPTFNIVALPGHSSDSIGLIYPADSSIFTGDILFRHGPTVVYYPDGNLTQYMATLNKIETIVKEQDIRVLYPGHGYPITNPLEIIEASREHRLDRLQQIKDALASGVERDADALVDAVYVGLEPGLRDAAFRSVKAQLLYLDETQQ